MNAAATTAEATSEPRCPRRFSRTGGVHRLDVKLLGQRMAARDFDRQVAKFQIRVAVMNGFTALGIPVTEIVDWVRPRKGEVRLSIDSCNKAAQMGNTQTYSVSQTRLDRGGNVSLHPSDCISKPIFKICICPPIQVFGSKGRV